MILIPSEYFQIFLGIYVMSHHDTVVSPSLEAYVCVVAYPGTCPHDLPPPPINYRGEYIKKRGNSKDKSHFKVCPFL
jgi:hypothetical protein